jgi:dTDP-4-dehydrorhamnose reductase
VAEAQRLLILGGSGFIGSALLKEWKPRPYVATYWRRPFSGGVRFNVSTERLADRLLLRGHGFTHAVLAQGVTKLAQCALMPHDSAATNVTGTLRAIDDLMDAGVHPIFLSSDAVFDGSPGLRTENDKPNPILAYGKDKLTVERYIQKLSGLWTILRLTKVISGIADNRNLLSQWITSIQNGQLIRCARDQLLTPVDLQHVIQAILFFVETNMTGLFQIAGSEVVSRYTLLQKLLYYLPEGARREARVQDCVLGEINSHEQLPQNCSLSSAKFASLSSMRSRILDEVCAQLCHECYDLVEKFVVL